MLLSSRLRIAFVFASISFSLSIALASGSTEKFFENASSKNALLNLINNTKQSLDIEIYEMEDPQVHVAIRAALKRGVKLRVVQEPSPVGETCFLFEPTIAPVDPECERKRALVKDVRDAGGTYVPFASKELCRFRGTKCFQHGKLVISDARFAFLSTGNFNSTSLCNIANNPSKCNRDYSVLTWDPGSVRTFRRVFEMDLKGRAYDLNAFLNHADAKKVTVSPFSEKPLLEFIRSAKELVQIQNQYLKDPELNQVIMEVAQRGVKVYVMVASACSFGRPDDADVRSWTRIYGGFDQAGVRTRTFSKLMKVGGLPGYLHAKAILVDSKRAWVGSVNGSESALNNNREFGIFIDDLQESLNLGAFLKSDFNSPQSQTWQESLECKKDPRSLQ
jgi:phosphatidylserine/phosphatidylglycerophosphate/cardiolipin synthase-like enzyme